MNKQAHNSVAELTMDQQLTKPTFRRPLTHMTYFMNSTENKKENTISFKQKQ